MAGEPTPKAPTPGPIKSLEDARRVIEELVAYINRHIVTKLNAPD